MRELTLKVQAHFVVRKAYITFALILFHRKAKEMRFILTNDNVNSYGFRVLSAGLDTTAFEKNPVMLHDHARGRLPIGRWADIRLEGGQLSAEAVFDEGDSFAMEIKRKVEAGYIKGASISFMPTELSDDYIPGQTRRTVSKAILEEASIVSVPSNRDSIRLSGHEITQELLNSSIPKIDTNKKAMQKDQRDKLLARLNLSAEATDEQILDAVDKLTASPAPAEPTVHELSAKLDKLAALMEKNESAAQTTSVIDLTAKIEALEERVKGARPSIAGVIQNLTANSPDSAEARENWDFDKWSKEDPDGLRKLSAEQPEAYKALVNNALKGVNLQY